MRLSMKHADVELSLIWLKYAFIKLSVNLWHPHEIYRENVYISYYFFEYFQPSPTTVLQ